MLRITVQELILDKDGRPSEEYMERFRQTVDTLDMGELIRVVNKTPRKVRADRGAKRDSAKLL